MQMVGGMVQVHSPYAHLHYGCHVHITKFSNMLASNALPLLHLRVLLLCGRWRCCIAGCCS
jgi:hypothetical protein